MNRTFAAILLSIGSIATAFGQGTVNFNNFVPAASINAPIFDVDNSTPLAGTAFKAQLYGGTSLGTIAPIGAIVPFFSVASGGAGYIDPSPDSSRSISTVAPGAMAVVVIRAWDASFASYEIASTTAGAKAGESVALTLTTGGVGSPASLPANMVGLTSFHLAIVGVPEPSVVAFGILGATGLLLRRRRN